MKRALFIVVFIGCVLGGGSVKGQIYYGVPPIDSFSFSFGAQDSLHHPFYNYSIIVDTSHVDSTNTYLWQIGNTSKAFFADSGTIVTAVMTDTVNTYPVNANSWFVLNSVRVSNVIVSFNHKYQTSQGHDGGIVEFSVDSGKTWNNIIGDCNKAYLFDTPNIRVNNFYNKNDTLLTGEPSFNGNSNGWVKSQFQFLWFPNIFKSTGNSGQGCSILPFNILEVRFRFKSDSIPDSIAGWIIGDIAVEQDRYTNGIPQLNKYQTLKVFPNPSTDAVYNFPILDGEQQYSIEIINAMGARVMRIPYRRQIDLSAYPVELYFYRVSNGNVNYSGKLLRE